jgi:hypothetical protein
VPGTSWKIDRYCSFAILNKYVFSNLSNLCLILISGLDPKTVLSQWYPTADLYPGRNVEGIYLLLSVPFLPRNISSLPPKDLVADCVSSMEDLRRRIMMHYHINDPNRKEWGHWFESCIPESQDTSLYIKSHSYHCPLLSFFRENTNYMPTWVPSAPTCSFSIFPRNVVVALPSVNCYGS